MRKTFATLGILVVLLVSLVGTVGAQDGTTPDVIVEDDAPVTEPVAGTKFFTHPVVKVLSAYFDREVEDVDDEVVDEVGEPLLDENGEPVLDENGDPVYVEDEEGTGEEPLENESGLGEIGEEIAALHEEGMGFGVLVKLYAMAEAAQLACTDAEVECAEVTAEELVASFQGGMGMGNLFKEYGKPALLGVGHVKQELKKLEKEQAAEVDDDGEGEVVDDEGEDLEGDETELESADTDLQGKVKDKATDNKPVKVKPVKNKGPKK